MLHPTQFEVNEAWIAFRLNSVPIRTEQDGEFNCVALMDAASCFILATEFVPIAAAEPRQIEVCRLLENAQNHKQQLPKTIFVPRENVLDVLAQEAMRQSIDIVRVSENELLIFIGEARQGFAEQFEKDRR